MAQFGAELRAFVGAGTEQGENVVLGRVEWRWLGEGHGRIVRTGSDSGGPPDRLSHPLAMMGAMEATSVRFAAAARTLGQVTRGAGLVVPGFRSPPRLRDADRSLRRNRSGSCTVSVRLKGRPWSAVVGDMIEGVIAANRLAGPTADRTRTALWAAVEAEAVRLQAVDSSLGRHLGVHRAPRSPAPAPSSPGDRRFPARLPAPPAPTAAPTRHRPPLRAVPATDVA